MTNPLSQFELSNWMRCSATDGEGFGCAKLPSHPGSHSWAHCEAVDLRGHRCMLTPRHPGEHQLAWYDRPTVPGETYTARYRGTASYTGALADTGARIYARYGWVQKSRGFEPGFLWRHPRLSRLLGPAADPHGQLTVVYEYLP